MSIETGSPSKLESTPLRVFWYDDETLVEFGTRIARANRVKSSIFSANNAIAMYMVEAHNRCDRLLNSGNELNQDLIRALSSVNCGAGYLQILNLVLSKGGSEIEAYSFFKWCLRTNELIAKNSSAKGLDVFTPDITKRRSFNRELLIAFANSFEGFKTPRWFQGNRTQFKDLCSVHLSLPAKTEIENGNLTVVYIGKNIFKSTRPDGYPDWLDWASETTPVRELVESELREDLLSFKNTTDEIENRKRQYFQLRETANGKLDKYNSWANNKLEEIGVNIHTLASLIIRIDAYVLTGFFGHDKNYTEMERTILSWLFKIDKQFPGLFVYPEAIPIWIDEKLKETGLPYSWDKPLSAELKRYFEMCLTDNEEELRGLKETDKKSFKVFNYDIRKLFSVLSSDEKEILCLYLNDQPEMEAMIFLDFLEKGLYQPVHKNKEMLEKFSEYSMKWIARNWKQAYKQLEAEIRRMREGKENVTDTQNHENYEEQEEVENEIRSLQNGQLEGWEVFYFTNRNDPMNSKYWELVKGSTIDERVTNLTDLITRNRIICTVKPSTLHGYLEDIVITPDEVENIRMTLEMGGVRFKKRKKAEGTRVLYKVDREARTLLFNLYHKEDWSYRKL